MESTIDTVPTVPVAAPKLSSPKLWISRCLTGIPSLFFLWGGVMQLAASPQVIEGAEKIGFARSTLPVLGVVQILCAVLLSFRRTAVFGAVLISAYLGGAVATHVRLGDPVFSVTLFPVYFAAVIWAGLYLRDERVRALSPFKA